MEPQTILIREDILIEKDGKFSLAGSRCKKCGQLFFPPKSLCVECLGNELEIYEIGDRGVLYSYTTSYMPSDHFIPPFTAGWIEMEGQIRFFAPILLKEGQSLKIGIPMVLTTVILREEEKKQVVGYGFEPGVKGEV